MNDPSRLLLVGALVLTLPGCGREEPPPPDQTESVDDASAAVEVSGQRVYDNNCLICHLPDGSGTPRLYPPLDGSALVTGDVDHLIRMTLLGVGVGGDSLEPSGEWDGVMNGFKHLSDEEIAAVLTHIRQAWSNQAGPVAPERVAEIRREISG